MTPDPIPFWERARGDGPVTRIVESQRRLRARLRLEEVEQQISSYRTCANGGLGIADRANLARLREEREELRVALGAPSLVRVSA